MIQFLIGLEIALFSKLDHFNVIALIKILLCAYTHKCNENFTILYLQ